jgi:hypothetical protein
MNDLAARADPRLQIWVENCSIRWPKRPEQIIATYDCNVLVDSSNHVCRTPVIELQKHE